MRIPFKKKIVGDWKRANFGVKLEQTNGKSIDDKIKPIWPYSKKCLLNSLQISVTSAQTQTAVSAVG